MATTVRIQNFQSIRDVTLTLDGLTVVTGQNNSGKSAVIRALAAMATNASPRTGLRTGTKSMSVEVTFSDGTHVLWEKGSGVNQYTLNGKVYAGVGSGVPEEVREKLGVFAVEAGGQELWPQIATQFDGSLFLLNKSGAVVAEAVSDVERVGMLAEASRLAESDARSVKAEQKLRAKDLVALTAQLTAYDRLPDLDLEWGRVLAGAEKIQKIEALRAMLERVQAQQRVSREVIDRLSPAETLVLPEVPAPPPFATYNGIADRLRTLRKQVQAPLPGEVPEVPPMDFSSLESMVRWLKVRRNFPAEEAIGDLPALPDFGKFERYIALLTRIRSRREAVVTETAELEAVERAFAEAAAAAAGIVDNLGICPLCGHDCGSHP